MGPGGRDAEPRWGGPGAWVPVSRSHRRALIAGVPSAPQSSKPRRLCLAARSRRRALGRGEEGGRHGARPLVRTIATRDSGQKEGWRRRQERAVGLRTGEQAPPDSVPCWRTGTAGGPSQRRASRWRGLLWDPGPVRERALRQQGRWFSAPIGTFRASQTFSQGDTLSKKTILSGAWLVLQDASCKLPPCELLSPGPTSWPLSSFRSVPSLASPGLYSRSPIRSLRQPPQPTL